MPRPTRRSLSKRIAETDAVLDGIRAKSGARTGRATAPNDVVDRLIERTFGRFVTPGFTPSPQQAAFLETVSAPGPSIVLEAVAGSGKTTTLVEGMRVMEGTIAFVAFNKKIVQEIEHKARERGVFDAGRHTISTVHSAGFTAIRAKGGRVKTEEKKCLWIARDAAQKKDGLDALIRPAVALVGLAKQALLLTTKEAQPAWAAVARRHSIDDNIPKGRTMRETVEFAQRILDESNRIADSVVDFDDMIYLPAMFDGYPIRQYDWVLVDEAQDTNAARRALVQKMMKPGGRLCAVGDRHQALYAFTGADSGALDLIADDVGAVRLPLSVSYRCPRAVVAEARQHVGHIEAHESAPEGEVHHVTVARDKLATLGLTQQDAIICRLNRPMVRTAYDLITAGIPCRIEGRDIGRTLVALTKKAGVIQTDTLAAIREKMAEWLTVETAEAARKDDENRRTAAEDKVGAIEVFAERVAAQEGPGADAEDVWQAIEAMFDDDVAGKLVLSSIHKAKGREWKRVFWLQAEINRKKPMKEWEVETEVCCRYVAITRAQESLTYLTIPKD